MRKIKKIFLVLNFVFLIINFKLLILNYFVIGAQTNFTDLGITISVNDSNVQNGDIICSDSRGYNLCKKEYDSSIYGIVNNTPSTSIETPNLNNSQIVVSKGEITVQVSSLNGNIKIGDFITSSKKAGIAELAIKEGYVIGTALENYSSSDKNATGQIKVSLNIHPNSTTATNVRQNLIDLLRSGLSGLGVDPISALRYILASTVVIASLVTGFIYFGRIAKTGVEAIGRNPLAGGRIETGVVINISIMLIIVGGGLGVAYLILAL